MSNVAATVHSSKPQGALKPALFARGGRLTHTDVPNFNPDPHQKRMMTLEQKRQRLEEIYRQEGAGGIERAEVCSLMDITFCLQRRHINAIPAPSIDEIRSKWPYLFHQRSLYAHFERLTDVNVLHLLELAMEEGGTAMIEYFRSKPSKKDVQTVLSRQREGAEVASNVVQLLMAHFKEDPDGLILLTDVSFFLLNSFILH